MGGPHCFWNFSQAPQTLDLGSRSGSLPLTHPYCVSAWVSGSVHPALQPKLDLPRCLLYLHSLHLSSPISLSPRPPYTSPFRLPSSIHWHSLVWSPAAAPSQAFPHSALTFPTYPIFLQSGESLHSFKASHRSQVKVRTLPMPRFLRI